jgi:small GTP-binding protein
MKQTEISFDEIIDNLILNLKPIENEPAIARQIQVLSQIRQRLFSGEIHIAVVGQFNRGKSTFINKLVKKDLLPTSVLPLTAIPTEIRYGEETKAVISFSDGSQEEASEKDVKESLDSFVTENRNPENKLSVTKAVVFCKSEFLAGSTVIIDTPGFGSTHIHNTKATLDILPQCDAVFFMLSADLPITQMELNFIKQIIPQSSRIFFVYNKIDLLSENEFTETTDFIKKTIKSRLNIDVGKWFLAVSAKTEKGMDVISNEVINFLQKEKFFSLSQALEKKLFLSIKAIKEAVGTINNSLDEKLNPLKNSLEKLKKELAENEILIKKLKIMEERLDDIPFFMPKINKVKMISDEVSKTKELLLVKDRIINSLLADNQSKSGNVFGEMIKEYSKKNLEISPKISQEEKNIRNIERSQESLRETLSNIQSCISLYTQ